MAKKFENQFCEINKFYPYGYYASRNYFKTKKDFIDALLEYFYEEGREEDYIKEEEISEAYVCWMPTPWELRDEIGDFAWIVCNKNKRNAQPCWAYGE